MKDSSANVSSQSRVPKSLELYEKAKKLIPKVTQLLSRNPAMSTSDCSTPAWTQERAIGTTRRALAGS